MKQKNHKEKWEWFRGWVSRNWWIILIFVLTGGFIYGYIITHYQLQTFDKYSIFVDLILIFLALIAAVSFGVYRLISQRVQIDAAKAARTEMLKSSGKLLTYIGFVYWEDFEISGYKETRYRDMAIELTQDAYASYASKLDDKDLESQRLICDIKNNLAWYYASRRSPDDRERACEYAEYIYKKRNYFPSLEMEWADTHNYVWQRYNLPKPHK